MHTATATSRDAVDERRLHGIGGTDVDATDACSGIGK